MKKALPIVLLSTLSAALVAVLVAVSAKPQKYMGSSDEPDIMFQKYGKDYAMLQTMEEEYDRLINKKFLSDDEKLLRDSLPIQIIRYKKDIGMELTQDEIDYETDYLNSLEMADPIKD